MLHRHLRRCFTAIPLLLCAFTASTNVIHADDLGAFVEARMTQQHLPGVSVAVVKDGKVIAARGFGWANLETLSAATPASVFELASVTKPFTATAILLLSYEKKLSLDDPVTRFIPELPASWRNVTIRHLLSHTSGIDDPIDEVQDPYKTRTRAEMLKLITSRPAKFQPGEDWAYNSSAYYLLGVVAEKVSGLTLGKYRAERGFRPLGMEQTRTNNLSAVIRNRASGYYWRNGGFRNVPPVNPTLIAGLGDIISTVLDLAKFDAGLQNDSILPASVREQLWTPARLNSGQRVTFKLPVKVLEGASYGLGWVVGDMHGHRYAAHGGISPSGFTTFMLRFLDDHLTVIVLTNRSDVEDPWRPGAPRPEEIAQGIAGFHIPALREQ